MSSADLPPEAVSRLERAAFSSGLSVPDFAACLHMGLRPVGLVQGYCVMGWSWYGMGSPYASSAYWATGSRGSTLSNYRCPHGYSYGMQSAEHRSWGSNVEQPWVTQAWADGYQTAFQRMVEEAGDAGAHGVIGVIDSSSHLIEGAIREFHMYGTAVVVEGADPPPAIWTSYLAGQRLAKLLEAGFFPVSVVASMVSVRVWSVCSTDVLLHGGYDRWGTVRPTDEIVQVADAEMQARRLVRDYIKRGLGHDTLQGAELEVGWHEIAEGDFERHCTLRGSACPPLQGRRSLTRAGPDGSSAMSDESEGDAQRRATLEAARQVYNDRSGTSARGGKAVTSDLSIDEALVLHSIDWQPVDLVCGAGVYSIPQGSWQWVVGEVEGASYAAMSALQSAAMRLGQECMQVGGAGVVGVRIDVSIERHAVNVVLLGTAVAPTSGSRPRGAAFVSDLSARDFALLHNAGWEVRGLAYGASFVHVPRRSAGTTVKQASQNVELTNFTEAMYAARETAMERMQSSALGQGSTGVVAVQVSEGPMEFASHAIGFTAWGTTVRAGPGGHKYLRPQVAVPLDDVTPLFDAASLRGK